MFALNSTVPDYSQGPSAPNIHVDRDSGRKIAGTAFLGAAIGGGVLYSGIKDSKSGTLGGWWNERRTNMTNLINERHKEANIALTEATEDWEKKYTKSHKSKSGKMRYRNMNPMHTGITNVPWLTEMHKALDKPTKKFWDLGGRGNFKQVGKSFTRGLVNSIPVVGGIWPMVDLAFAATSDDPIRTYASAVATQIAAPVGFRLGAGVGGWAGTAMTLPRTMTIAGGIVGGAITGIAGAMAFEAGDILAGVGKTQRYTAFNSQFHDSEGAATMRQASLMAIRNSELNNRNFILGNEASYFTGM